jgi:phage N-6-adenine-methyltransferase
MPMPVQKPGFSKQDYGTPWPLIRAIERRWGKLTIDLAARADNAKAPSFITPEEDSLKQDWAERIGDGRAFLNMEFADIAPWVSKCAEWLTRSKPSLRGSIRVLTPASIGAEWFADHCEGKAKVVGLRPRICFEGCHQLFPKNHPRAGERKCLAPCLGCATYPQDCMLTLWGSRFDSEPIFQTWRWDVPSSLQSEWLCEGCGRSLHASDLTRVGIGVHHYNRDKAGPFGSGLLNCGLVRRIQTASEAPLP